ncbi:RDD family protein [Actinomadura sp. BRA 177]|uniref:RDD family protein n=1 Tax=Actinomadura sp. BRA 177 TaxID=2745202 RepID=UPI002815F2B0|nr:RDD family protein [Actinomadura sp. BRA 177]
MSVSHTTSTPSTRSRTAMAVPLAEPGQRLLARVVDTLVVGVPVIVVVRELVSGHMLDVIAPPAVAGCMLLYEAVQLALWGRTLGKRFAGIEVVAALPVLQAGGADAEETGGVTGVMPVSVPGFVPVSTTPEEAQAVPGEATPGRSAPGSPGEVEAGGHPGVLQCVLRAAVYSLPIAARPIPVFGLLASVFWVANAGLMFEGTRRQAVHDRLAGTAVVKRARPDSPAF